jgi:3-oxoacyl-[acyl-carrier-protein] synthase-3
MSIEYPALASITGWGKCVPSTLLSNDDLSTFLDTSNDWIVRRTGIRQRPISHVPVSELAQVAGARALACAGLASDAVELIILGSCTGDDQMPNTASRVQRSLGADHAAAMDVNTACTSFMYALSVGSSLIRTGAVSNALVIGADTLSRCMDWTNRGPAVLFGDAAGAIVLQRCQAPSGIVGEVLGCETTNRDMLRINGIGMLSRESGGRSGGASWVFDGPEIFRQAVAGMVDASRRVLNKCGISPEAIDLVIPHQANLRIIESVARRLNYPLDRVFSNVERYGNLSSASIPVAIVDAIEEGRIKAGSMLLLPAFGGGLTWSAHVLKWAERVTGISIATIGLPGSSKTALELVEHLRAQQHRHNNLAHA